MAVSELKIAKKRVWNRKEDELSRQAPVNGAVDRTLGRPGRSTSRSTGLQTGPCWPGSDQELTPTGAVTKPHRLAAGHQAGLTGFLAGPTGHPSGLTGPQAGRAGAQAGLPGAVTGPAGPQAGSTGLWAGQAAAGSDSSATKTSVAAVISAVPSAFTLQVRAMGWKADIYYDYLGMRTGKPFDEPIKWRLSRSATPIEYQVWESAIDDGFERCKAVNSTFGGQLEFDIAYRRVDHELAERQWKVQLQWTGQRVGFIKSWSEFCDRIMQHVDDTLVFTPQDEGFKVAVFRKETSVSSVFGCNRHREGPFADPRH
ncbi:hypothetical protein QYE76_010520 [Lolium multiflorum]|uniref:Uncharacterized protein n=1 Tax=Lolium multiflorum TaxID=4521 RepID=A0AAD8TXD2_LOLMU|nr:hypothetical protein QYE76_010520 [Lolium multiflorum]